MSGQRGRRQWLDGRIGEAAARRRRARTETRRQNRPRPRPGDVFVFAETARWPVQWAIVAERLEKPRRLLVVAVDSHPLLGSRDVQVPSESSMGASNLRCGIGVWMEPQRFVPQLRTGYLEKRLLGLAVGKRTEVASGNIIASTEAFETDRETEYQEWVEGVLEKAKRTLAGFSP